MSPRDRSFAAFERPTASSSPSGRREQRRDEPPDDEERPKGMGWISLALGLAGAATIAFAHAIPVLGPPGGTMQYLLIQGGLQPLSGLAWFIAWPQFRWPDKRGAAGARLMTLVTVFVLLQLAWWVRVDYRLGALALLPPALTLAMLGINWRPQSDRWAVWLWRVFYLVPAAIAILCVLWLVMPWPKPVVEVRQIMAGDVSGGLLGVFRWIGRHVLHFAI